MKDELNIQIGLRVRQVREYLNLTRENLAERANLSFQFIAEIETGKKSMTTTSLYKVAKALNVSTDFLVFGADKQDNNNLISEIFSTLTPENRIQAEELLKVLIKIVTFNNQNYNNNQ